jgi:hypothetical protein
MARSERGSNRRLGKKYAEKQFVFLFPQELLECSDKYYDTVQQYVMGHETHATV